MVNQWEPGTQYNYNDVVQFNGVAYKIIQPHRSQGDWQPDRVPALWGRMQDQSCVQSHHQQQQGGYDQGRQGYNYGGGHDQGQQQQGQQQQQYAGGAAPSKEEQKTNWYDLSDERKKELEIGGGLLAGAALLGGGFAAFQHHKKGQEDQKAQAWALSNWLQDAEARTHAFRQYGPQGKPYTWILCRGKDIPREAIQGGNEKGGPLFIARALYENGLHLGKAGRHLEKGGVIGYGGKEVEVDTFEVLIGDPSSVKWVSLSSNEFSAQRVVEGGKESNGTPLYIAQAPHGGGVHPGKYSQDLKGCCIAYGGKEVIVKEFQVLVLQ